MRLRFTRLGAAYFALMLFAVAGTLYATIRIYTDAGRDLPDVYSACLGHTAAVMGIFAIIGAGDMFFRFEESKELQEERRKREADLQKAAAASDARLERALAGMREEREFHQALREQEWAQREQERAEERARREDERAQWEQEQIRREPGTRRGARPLGAGTIPARTRTNAAGAGNGRRTSSCWLI